MALPTRVQARQQRREWQAELDVLDAQAHAKEGKSELTQAIVSIAQSKRPGVSRLFDERVQRSLREGKPIEHDDLFGLTYHGSNASLARFERIARRQLSELRELREQPDSPQNQSAIAHRTRNLETVLSAATYSKNPRLFPLIKQIARHVPTWSAHFATMVAAEQHRVHPSATSLLAQSVVRMLRQVPNQPKVEQGQFTHRALQTLRNVAHDEPHRVLNALARSLPYQLLTPIGNLPAGVDYDRVHRELLITGLDVAHRYHKDAKPAPLTRAGRRLLERIHAIEREVPKGALEPNINKNRHYYQNLYHLHPAFLAPLRTPSSTITHALRALEWGSEGDVKDSHETTSTFLYHVIRASKSGKPLPLSAIRLLKRQLNTTQALHKEAMVA